MFSIRELVQPSSLEEAHEILTARRNNTILGGCGFLRMGSKRIATGIDLSLVNLEYVKKENDYIEIGALTNLRELEVNPLLAEGFNGILAKAVGNIIGVQLRNTVTVGASVFSRYGFSDLLTALLALDTEVELYKGGRMGLAEFLKKPFDKDILTRVFIKQNQRRASYQAFRNSASDYPVLNAAVSQLDDQWTIVLGARPGRAAIAHKASEEVSKISVQGDLSKVLSPENLEYVASLAVEELTFGTNARATAPYREALGKVLVTRGIREVYNGNRINS